VRTLSILFWLSCVGLVDAAVAADCENEYSSDQLLTDLIEAEELLKTEDKPAILAKSKGMESGLSCMKETLPPILISRVFRAIAGGLFYAGEEARGRAWFLTAVEVDPSYIYGIEDIGANHPIRLAYDELRRQAVPDPVAVDGMMLREGPRHLLDGRRLREAAARQDRPHLYQLEENGVQSWVIEGNALPQEALSGSVVADAGKADEGADKKGKKAKEKVAKAPKPAKKPKAAKAPKPEKAAKPEKETVAKAPKPEKAAKPEKETVAKAPKPEKETVAKAPKPEKAAKPEKEAVAKAPKPEKAAKPEKEAVAKAPKPEKAAKPAKEPKPAKVAVAKAPKPVKTKPVKTKAKPMVLKTTVIGRDRPPEQIPLIVTGALAVVGGGVLYALAVSNQNAFDNLAEWNGSSSEQPTSRQDLIRKQQTANRLFLGSFGLAAAGLSTLTYGVIIDARTGRVMPTFNVRF
jgi:hypothetical protein